MIYKFNEKVSVEALADLRESVGWNRMEREYQNPLMSSYYHIAVYEDDKLIGYIDSVSNGVTDAYIQDLMISPNYQGNASFLFTLLFFNCFVNMIQRNCHIKNF